MALGHKRHPKVTRLRRFARSQTSRPLSPLGTVAGLSWPWQVWDHWALSVSRITTVDEALVLLLRLDHDLNSIHPNATLGKLDSQGFVEFAIALADQHVDAYRRESDSHTWFKNAFVFYLYIV